MRIIGNDDVADKLQNLAVKVDMNNNMEGITTLFLDIGGVLLTSGWDRAARKKTYSQ